MDNPGETREQPQPAAPPETPKTTEAGPPPTKEKAADQKSAAPAGILRRHPRLLALAALVLLAAAIAGVAWWLNARHFEATDDAFIDGRPFAISPKVAGYIVEVAVTDNQWVDAGAVIARIDPRDYENALAEAEARRKGASDAIAGIDAQIVAQKAQIEQAQAQVTQSKAALQFAQQQFDRATQLQQTGAGTVQNAQQTESALRQAQADLNRVNAAVVAAQSQIANLQAQRANAVASLSVAKAERDQAELNLSYATIRAAQAGHIARLTAAKGQYVQPGQNLSMFVPDPLWVTANFKETQITDMRPGQPVDIEVDAYPDHTFHGHVASIQPGSGTVFSLLPAENATGNFVKVVQRVPVKIVFDNLPTDITLGPGMSVEPSVRVR